MRINNRALSFYYDDAARVFVAKTTEPEYIKMIMAENPLDYTFEFEFNENTVRQLCKYFSLRMRNNLDPLPEEDLI